MSYFRLGREIGFRAGFQFDVGLALGRDHHFPEILDSTFFFCSSVSARSVLEFRCGFQFHFGFGLERDHHFPEILASRFLFL